MNKLVKTVNMVALGGIIALSGCTLTIGGRTLADRRDFSKRDAMEKAADDEVRTWGNVTNLVDTYMSIGEVEKANMVAKEADKIDSYRGVHCRDLINKYTKYLEKGRHGKTRRR